MPLFKRKTFEATEKPEMLRDDEEVFFCEVTKEIFRNYEDYFARIMFINSTVWSCSLSGRPNLTYAEAIDSERQAAKLLRTFPKFLRVPVLMTIEKTKRSSIIELVDDVYSYLRDRFFIGESVEAIDLKNAKDQYQHCKVLAVIIPENIPKDQIEATHISYCVRRDGNELPLNEWIATTEQIRRPKGFFTKEILKLFLKQSIQLQNGWFTVNPDAYTAHSVDNHIKESDVFIGKAPSFEQSKKFKKVTENGKKATKQTSISKYLHKNDGKSATGAGTKTKTTNSNRVEESKRLKAEKEQKEAERLQKVAEDREKHLADVALAIKQFNAVKEDLELQDQRPMPIPKAIQTLIPEEHFGDFLLILEFMHTFSDLLSIRDKFSSGVTMDILTRALLKREVAGPLSDILQVLLSSICTLQLEEDSEANIEYPSPQREFFKQNDPIDMAVKIASGAIHFPERQFGTKMYRLPMDATTISELLRIHLLGSGARCDFRSAKWRYQQRGGYQNTDDPGLHLCMHSPHIVRMLATHTVFQLPLADIINILTCLISQILTYSSVRDAIDERLEQAVTARNNLRLLVQNEKKRETKMAEKIREVTEAAKEQIKNVIEPNATEQTAKINTHLNNKVQKITASGDAEKKIFEQQLASNQRDNFAYQIYLGADRAHRSYWLFESLPGLFVEHKVQIPGQCLEQQVKNIPGLVDYPKDGRIKFIKQMLRSIKMANDKENKSFKSSKKVQNGVAPPPQPPSTSSEKESTIETQTDLFMCSSRPDDCPVHSETYSSRVQWSVFNTEDDLNELINALNTRGLREKQLREQLESEKELILAHIQDCPITQLQVLPEDSEKCLEACVKQMRKYENSNLFLPPGTDLQTIMSTTLKRYLLDFEEKIRMGYLGAIRVSDVNKWRTAIECEIDLPESYSKTKYGLASVKYEDPGKNLTIVGDINTEDNKAVTLLGQNSIADGSIVKMLATALLQIEQGIDKKFLKEPFGFNKELKDKKVKEQRLARAQIRLSNWEMSLMASTSYSQVFLHYNTLYDSIQWSQSASNATCTICRRRNTPETMLLCDGCNRGHHMSCLKPKLKKVPEGDWFCPNCCPKVEKKREQRQRKIFNYLADSADEEEEEESEEKAMEVDEDQNEIDEDNDDEVEEVEDEEEEENNKSDERNEEDEDEDEIASDNDINKFCGAKEDSNAEESENDEEYIVTDFYAQSKPGCKNCETNNGYHNSSKRRRFDPNCRKCKRVKLSLSKRVFSEESAGSEEEEPEDDDSDAPLSNRTRHAKRRRPIQSLEPPKKRRSARRSSEETVSPVASVIVQRRSRRTADDLPLDSVRLYSLLEEIVKHEDSWPFNRPVPKIEVPDYYDIIKCPMDFAKIKSRLNVGNYRTNEDLANDIRQVFQNCEIYNTSETEIYQAGARLETFIAEKCSEMNLPFRPSEMIASVYKAPKNANGQQAPRKLHARK